MANVEHASLTGAALHEPKGVEVATIGQVYVANGLGSGSWTSLTSTNPVGFVGDFAGSVAPPGWLLCFGQAISRTTYAQLFAVVGTTYGAGNGSTTFNVPDIRGMVTAGKDNMGGSTRGLLTVGGSAVSGTTLGASGGVEYHTLTINQLPPHTHENSLSDPTHTHIYTAPSSNSAIDQGGPTVGSNPSSFSSATGASLTGITINNASVGGGFAHSSTQPTLILNKIIFANA